MEMHTEGSSCSDESCHRRVSSIHKRVVFGVSLQALLVGVCEVASCADRMHVDQNKCASNPEMIKLVQLKHTIFAAIAADMALHLIGVTPCLHGKNASRVLDLVRDTLFQHLKAIRGVSLSFVGNVHALWFETVRPLRHL